MSTVDQRVVALAPPRFTSPSVFSWVILVGFAAFFIQGFLSADVTLARMVQGFGNLGTFSRRPGRRTPAA